MAQDNLATARRLYAAFSAACEPPDVADLVHPDVVVEEVADFPDEAVYRDHSKALAAAGLAG